MPTSTPRISRTCSSSRAPWATGWSRRTALHPCRLDAPVSGGRWHDLHAARLESRSGPASGRQPRLRLPCCSRVTQPRDRHRARPGVNACPSGGGRARPGRVPRRIRERAATVRRWDVVHSRSGAGETTGRRGSSRAKSAGMSSRAHRHRASGNCLAGRLSPLPSALRSRLRRAGRHA